MLWKFCKTGRPIEVGGVGVAPQLDVTGGMPHSYLLDRAAKPGLGK